MRAPNPVALHRFHILRELDVVQFIEQLIGVLSHAQEPLSHILLNDLETASPAAIILHLLIGKYGITIVAPIDWSEASLNQPSLIETEEKFLIPVIILRRRRSESPPPIIRISHPFLISTNHHDVTLRHGVRMSAFLLRGIFGRHPEGIVAHRIEDILAHQTLETSHSISNGVVAYVAHVHVAGGVREHFEAVELRTRIIDFGFKEARLLPA